MVAERAPASEGWFDVSTLKEPYRIEGKKTMGYEVVEQLGWEVPDAIFYPTGGGVGLIGMWKAFDEMETSGLDRVKAAEDDRGADRRAASRWCARLKPMSTPQQPRSGRTPTTVAAGLRVPKPLGDFLILQAVREERRHGHRGERPVNCWRPASGWRAIEGMFAAPEGAACVAGACQSCWLQRLPETLPNASCIYNTGTGLKYAGGLRHALPAHGRGQRAG